MDRSRNSKTVRNAVSIAAGSFAKTNPDKEYNEIKEALDGIDEETLHDDEKLKKYANSLEEILEAPRSPPPSKKTKKCAATYGRTFFTAAELLFKHFFWIILSCDQLDHITCQNHNSPAASSVTNPSGF